MVSKRIPGSYLRRFQTTPPCPRKNPGWILRPGRRVSPVRPWIRRGKRRFGVRVRLGPHSKSSSEQIIWYFASFQTRSLVQQPRHLGLHINKRESGENVTRKFVTVLTRLAVFFKPLLVNHNVVVINCFYDRTMLDTHQVFILRHRGNPTPP